MPQNDLKRIIISNYTNFNPYNGTYIQLLHMDKDLCWALILLKHHYDFSTNLLYLKLAI